MRRLAACGLLIFGAVVAHGEEATPEFPPAAVRADAPAKGLPSAIFSDDFERGDTTAWSRAVGLAPPDTTPPAITIDAPVDGASLIALAVDVTGTVTDANPITSVTVNGVTASLTGNDFAATVILAAGANTIAVTASDNRGNTATVEVGVTTTPESTPPSIAVVAPVAGVFLASSQPQVEIVTSDGESGLYLDGFTLTANGLAVAADCTASVDGALCQVLSSLPEGPVHLVVTAVDRALNTATASTDFTVDTAGVEIDVTAPVEGLVTMDATVAVSGTVGPGVTAVTVNDVAAVLSGGGFSATVDLREGMNTIVAHAVKANGNSRTASLEVTRDTTAPNVKIQTPRDGLVAVEDRIAVTGLVNDTVSGGVVPRILVNGAEALVAGGSFMLVDLELVPGPNLIEVVATDAVGNEDRDQVAVQFQKVAGARLVEDAGNGQIGMVTEAVANPLAVRVVDEIGNPVAGRVVTFDVTRNSGTLRRQAADPPARSVQAVTDGAGRASALLTLGDTVGEGNNRVRVTGLGIAGEVEFCASGLAALPDKILMVEGDNQRGAVGTPLNQSFEALVVDADGNPISDIELTFEVRAGGGTLVGETALTRTTDIDGIARVVLTLGPQSGINNNVVETSFANLAGVKATFVASGLDPGNPALTELTGTVLDASLDPIPGSRVTIKGTAIEALTDDQGRFLLTGVPVGRVEVEIDPSTSSRPEVFPPLSFERVAVAGQRTPLGQPILIPVLDTTSSRAVGGSEDVTLTMSGVEGLSLTVFADSVTFPDGSSTGTLTISQVHLDKVPMIPPNGTVFMAPAWTIQPAGVVFDPPARITLPNDGLPPGRVIDLFQFDHDRNRFINVGAGTVSDDGLVVISDPGFGITLSGWGGGGQPPPPQGDAEKDPCEDAVDRACDEADSSASSPTRLFATNQKCIAQDSCSGRPTMEDPDWLDKVMPKFIDDFVDRTGLWDLIILQCHLDLVPLLQDRICAARMATYHISVDLLSALIMEGCGTDADWLYMQDVIALCTDRNMLPLEDALAVSVVVLMRDTVRAACQAIRDE